MFGNANVVRNVGRGAFGNANADANAVRNCKFEFILAKKCTVGAVLD